MSPEELQRACHWVVTIGLASDGDGPISEGLLNKRVLREFVQWIKNEINHANFVAVAEHDETLSRMLRKIGIDQINNKIRTKRRNRTQ